MFNNAPIFVDTSYTLDRQFVFGKHEVKLKCYECCFTLRGVALLLTKADSFLREEHNLNLSHSLPGNLNLQSHTRRVSSLPPCHPTVSIRLSVGHMDRVNNSIN